MPIYQLVLPSMGESVSEATITQWLKKVGDTVAADEAVVEVATDKVDSEVASEHTGVIKEILHPLNAVVAVDEPLVLIETEATVVNDITVVATQATEDDSTPKVDVEVPEKIMRQAQEIVAPSPVKSPVDDNRFYSPLVKNIAKQEQISEAELATISGTGKDGRVTKRDILDYVNSRSLSKPANPEPTPAVIPAANKQPFSKGLEDVVIPMSRMEQLISEHMTRSIQTSAHVQSFIEIDTTKLWNWRESVKQDFVKKHGVKLTFTPIFLQLVAEILSAFPLLNSSVDGTNIIKKKDINLGMATALSDGNLIVPVIKQADSLNLVGLAKKVNELASNARNNSLNPDDVQGGTYTVTNVGMFGSLTGTPVINQPQVAILALGAIRKIPAVLETEHGDVIAVRQQMIVSHSYDHRIINGAMGGMFLLRLKERIENWDDTLKF